MGARTTSGRIVTSLPTVGVTDDIFYDSGRHLVYVIGGEGAVEVLRQHDLDNYQRSPENHTGAWSTHRFVRTRL